ncbi:beta-phosphoglucomutase [Paenibacillus sp. FSL R7-0331]|uniref:beta-phosphoglucomutase n=1 Tax=Paenibacillus sp. FSL R7-0331 TaxID=1536773 RepID=UPI0004F76606|nr:beta-phosphoglucomutase [Paenibacillus sp. FSL R7-0331]AIQ51286.1 beta-phosphoglucomutase [Paenibacillus sp. FSL R7-0331]
MIKAVIFDLDGVIVSTDEYHYQAWKQISDAEGIPFDREANERLRGVSRMESLELILEKASKRYTEEQKLALAERKNVIYRELLNRLSKTDILPGVMKLITALQERHVLTAIGSSSKNTPVILNKIGLENVFDAVVDGNDIKNSKPDPEVFLLAAERLRISPEDCIVVEDAEAGIAAARAAGMKTVGVGAAAGLSGLTVAALSLEGVSVQKII